MYTTFDTYYSVCCPGWNVPIQPGQQTVTKKEIISTSCCIHMVVPPDDGPRYARNV